MARRAASGRRQAGAGSVFQRASDGRWVGSISEFGLDGRREKRVVYGASRDEVLGKLDGLKLRAGLRRRGAPRTVAELLAVHLEGCALSMRPRSFSQYQRITELHLIPALGSIEVVDLTTADVQHFVAGLSSRKGLAPRTVRNVRNVLQTALAYAIVAGWVPRNVARGVRMPREVSAAPLAVDAALVEAVSAAVAGTELETIVGLAMVSGLRQGELLGLRWSDVSLDGAQPTLYVRQAAVRHQGATAFAEPKTVKSRRPVPLAPTTVAVLRAHRQAQRKAQLTARQWRQTGLVFCDERGEPLIGPTVTRHFQIALRRARVRRLTFHQLRHIAVSRWLQAGVDVRTTADLAGHASLAMLTVYSHSAPDRLRDAVERVARPR